MGNVEGAVATGCRSIPGTLPLSESTQQKTRQLGRVVFGEAYAISQRGNTCDSFLAFRQVIRLPNPNIFGLSFVVSQ
ncbi:hypothetical protein PsAD2_03012 [Pseudovibrio axinellae]|uniref:Uncharacterized protein n=1 Tax=Pseudovibrio axinellae TaxID=989403 RepID=A0A165XGA2_9HYPH|nr:hypothetical protein PsAD2_03012 [Pseudovibrio axinellae]SER44052.1 hypothetical protein SAMN05421798_11070 [Pseudovibrio axinellae]